MIKTAELSPCRTYRYKLQRVWGSGAQVAFIGLNPSTADEKEDDPTIRRCIGFAKAWGYSGLCMLNLFAFRATDPRVMKMQKDPVGPDNTENLLQVSQSADLVIAAWGTHGSHLGRDREITGLIPRLYCLQKTSGGHPGHPLYLKSTLRPIPFNFEEQEDWV